MGVIKPAKTNARDILISDKDYWDISWKRVRFVVIQLTCEI